MRGVTEPFGAKPVIVSLLSEEGQCNVCVLELLSHVQINRVSTSVVGRRMASVGLLKPSLPVTRRFF